MLVALIVLPALVQWLQNESKWTVKQYKTTVAFHLAEAGIDRAFVETQGLNWHVGLRDERKIFSQVMILMKVIMTSKEANTASGSPQDLKRIMLQLSQKAGILLPKKSGASKRFTQIDPSMAPSSLACLHLVQWSDSSLGARLGTQKY